MNNFVIYFNTKEFGSPNKQQTKELLTLLNTFNIEIKASNSVGYLVHTSKEVIEKCLMGNTDWKWEIEVKLTTMPIKKLKNYRSDAE